MEAAEMSDKNWTILRENPSWAPGAPRKASVAHFRLLTRHNCLRSHLHRIGIADSPDCSLRDFANKLLLLLPSRREGMNVARACATGWTSLSFGATPPPQYRHGTGGKYSPSPCTRDFSCDSPQDFRTH
ncbi:hypothetical protein TNCV_3489791 [Trichonephila clavipes]|nr:hypothetical protein TNCV_3489791 [Trichonephila clavipes]